MPTRIHAAACVGVTAMLLSTACDDGRSATATTALAVVQTGPPKTTSPAQDGCTNPKTVHMQGGNVIEVNTLAEIGRYGGSVMVVEVSDERPITALDEDPAQGASFPNVFTRYDLAVAQIVVWPDSAPVPAVGDPLTLDIVGGTLGCFTLEVDPPPTMLEPGGTYLIAAGIRDGEHLMLWNGTYAMEVIDGGIRDPGVTLPTPMMELIGQPTSALPTLSVVESVVEP